MAAEFADNNGNWKCGTFGHLLPNNIILKIASIQPPMDQRRDYQVYWADSTKGIFTVKSAYHAISNYNQGMEDQIWSLAWGWKGPQCIRIFIWLVLHDRLKTNSELMRRHIPKGTNVVDVVPAWKTDYMRPVIAWWPKEFGIVSSSLITTKISTLLILGVYG